MKRIYIKIFMSIATVSFIFNIYFIFILYKSEKGVEKEMGHMVYVGTLTGEEKITESQLDNKQSATESEDIQTTKNPDGNTEDNNNSKTKDAQLVVYEKHADVDKRSDSASDLSNSDWIYEREEAIRILVIGHANEVGNTMYLNNVECSKKVCDIKLKYFAGSDVTGKNLSDMIRKMPWENVYIGGYSKENGTAKIIIDNKDVK